MIKIAREAWWCRAGFVSSDGVAVPSATVGSTSLDETVRLSHGCPATVTQRSAINTNLADSLHQLPYSLTAGHGSTLRKHPANMNLRKAPASSMQKTYDECYLTCSTAIYFEGQVG